ncbi:hypothetical protein [Pseudomonas syringae group genomosp. 3]|uniref:hypothetical protein n=1 Tax=Pseudomonas syringae group genomosp. 3 TaxID=251701 RepID=UPI000ADBABC0|nr:hypothetical protein [Pseudomonas syringae group genomosp. 3]
MPTSFKPRPLKNLSTANGCWAGLLESGGLRQILVSLAIDIMQRFKDMKQRSKP